MSTSSSSSSGIGFFGMLTIVFITLKLLHIINWSWWLVLAPMWIGLSITLLFMLIFMAIVLVAASSPNTKFKITRK